MSNCDLFEPKPGDIIEAGKHPACGTEPLIAWLKAHGLDPDAVYRVDIGGDGFMTVYEYALKDGSKFMALNGRDVATLLPRKMPYAG